MLKLSLLLSSLILNVNPLDFGKEKKHAIHKPIKGVKDYKTGGPITIHVVPHSHDDVGWRTTVDGYFDGSTK